MSTINLQGIPSNDAFQEILNALADKFQISGSGIALQAEEQLGATITFRNWKPSRQNMTKVEEVLQIHRELHISSNFRGLTVLYAPEYPVVDIIAVHGLGGHAADTWTYKSSSKPVFWLRDLLPRKVKSARIMTFGYDSDLISRSITSLKQIGMELLNQSSAEREDPQRPLIFVAHSLGGLVVKMALTTSKNEAVSPDIFTSTKSVFFLGTPHRGSNKANLAKVFTTVASIARSTAKQHLDTLKRDSRPLEELSQAFLPLTIDGTLQLRSFYETQKTRIMVGKFFRWRSVLIVDSVSACIGSSAEKTFPIAADHLSICKFDHESNAGFRQIIAQLREICRNLGINPSDSTLFLPNRLPLDRNFFGRQDTLRQIHEALWARHMERSLKCLCLHGDPGVGKTQLAAKAAFNMSKTFRHILFVQADTTQKLLQSFLAIGRRLALAAEDPETVRERVLVWLEKQDSPWLLIFDNVEEARPLLDYLPPNGRGSIILTSRNGKIADYISVDFSERRSMRIGSMSPDEGRDFLISQLKDAKDLKTNQDDLRKISLSVAERFSYHPLALRQASAFIRETGSTISQLWELLRNDPRGDVPVYEYQDQSTPYEDTLWKAWRMMISKLKDGPAKLLTILCLFDPDGIPDELFLSTKNPPRDVENTNAYHSVEYLGDRAPLMSYEIIARRDEETISVHRLVQRVRLNTVSIEEKREAFAVALGLLTQRFPKQYLGAHLHDQWPRCEIFLPHVLAVDTLVRQLNPKLDEPEKYIDMLCDCTWYLWEIEQYDEALSRLEQLEKLCNETIGMKTLQGARILVNRGSIYARYDRLLDSGSCFRRALEIRRALLPSNDQLLANSYMQVGNWYTSQGQFDRAEHHLKLAIDTRNASSDSILGQTIISHQNLARCLQMAGKLEQAEKEVNKSEEIERKMEIESKEAQYHKFGRLFILGNIYLGHRNFDMALKHFMSVYEGRRSLSISAGPLSAACHKVGVAHQELGHYKEACDWFSKEIEIIEKIPRRVPYMLVRLARARFSYSLALNSLENVEKSQEMRSAAIANFHEATKQDCPRGLADIEEHIPYIDR